MASRQGLVEMAAGLPGAAHLVAFQEHLAGECNLLFASLSPDGCNWAPRCYLIHLRPGGK